MKKVIFTEDFATKKKGETFICDGLLANTLVYHDKVAKYTNEEKVEKVEKKAESKKKAD